jgi:cobalt/nickel transport system ATP-binding protein
MDVIELRSEFAVRVNGLKYSYPDGTPALRGIDLVVRRGESVAIMGPNGAGKSTLTMHLNGILSGEGRVEVMGIEVNKKNLKQVRSIVGLVFQDPDDQLFSPTVREDVAFGPLNMRMPVEDVEKAVKRALEWVGMEGSEERSPHHMSFGEKKRVSLATVLSMDPDILVLDEPAANMDPRGRREFIELLSCLKVTRLVVTHDLDMARQLCPRTIVMEKGRVVADGATSNLLSDRDFLYRSGLA